MQDSSLVPSIHIGQLTTTGNFCSRDTQCPWLPRTPALNLHTTYSHSDTYMQMIQINVLLRGADLAISSKNHHCLMSPPLGRTKDVAAIDASWLPGIAVLGLEHQSSGTIRTAAPSPARPCSSLFNFLSPLWSFPSYPEASIVPVLPTPATECTVGFSQPGNSTQEPSEDF